MNEFRRKIMDLKTDDKELLLNSFNKILNDTIESKDEDFDNRLIDFGRFIIALITAKRISFKILKPINECNENHKHEIIS